jgi:hypothetical protein
MTLGAVYGTRIRPMAIEIEIRLPCSFILAEDEAILLERTLHNVLELALAPLFGTYTCTRGGSAHKCRGIDRPDERAKTQHGTIS